MTKTRFGMFLTTVVLVLGIALTNAAIVSAQAAVLNYQPASVTPVFTKSLIDLVGQFFQVNQLADKIGLGQDPANTVYLGTTLQGQPLPADAQIVSASLDFSNTGIQLQTAAKIHFGTSFPTLDELVSDPKPFLTNHFTVINPGDALSQVDVSTPFAEAFSQANNNGSFLLVIKVVGVAGGAPSIAQMPTLNITYTTAEVVNLAPHITSTPTTTEISETDSFSYQLTAVDPENDPLTYHLASAPADMQIDSQGLVSWTTNYDSAGVYPITVQVSDGINSVEQSFSLTVLNVNRAPAAFNVLAPKPANGPATVPTTFSWEASVDPDSDPVTYTLYLADMGGLGSQPNYQLAGAGISATEYTVQNLKYNTPYLWYVESSDGSFIVTSDLAKFSTVTRTNNPPVANAGDDQTVISGDLVTLDASKTTDPDAEDVNYLGYIWTIVGDSGLPIDLQNGNSVNPTFIAPTVTEPTSVTFRLWVTDSQAFSTDEVTVIINPLSTP